MRTSNMFTTKAGAIIHNNGIIRQDTQPMNKIQYNSVPVYNNGNNKGMLMQQTIRPSSLFG
jgi:hypothetical protein